MSPSKKASRTGFVDPHRFILKVLRRRRQPKGKAAKKPAKKDDSDSSSSSKSSSKGSSSGSDSSDDDDADHDTDDDAIDAAKRECMHARHDGSSDDDGDGSNMGVVAWQQEVFATPPPAQSRSAAHTAEKVAVKAKMSTAELLKAEELARKLG